MRDQVLDLVKRYLPGPFRGGTNGNILTKCPFHKGGQENSASFSINLDSGLFHCFTGGCESGGGGDIRYMLRLLGLPRHAIDTETKIIGPILERNRELHAQELQNFSYGRDPFKADYELPEALLGVYEWLPTQLVEKGFNWRVLKDLEVGFDKANQRITYPLRDMYGTLAGISGGATQPWQKPKYKVYEGRKRSIDRRWIPGDFGDWFDDTFPDYRCENHDFLWNFHRVSPGLINLSVGQGTIYVVEGFKACLWMIQHGYPNTVALMGSSISERQQRMLHRLGVTVVLLLDNDAPGREATLRIGDLLWRPLYGKVNVAQYPDGDDDTQPDSYSGEQLAEITSTARPYIQHLHHEMRKRGILRWV